MFTEIITTITHRIDLSGEEFDVQHAVSIDAGDASGLPNDVIYAIVVGGCNSVVASLTDGVPDVTVYEQQDEVES